jgi:hypothetical protein
MPGLDLSHLRIQRDERSEPSDGDVSEQAGREQGGEQAVIV